MRKGDLGIFLTLIVMLVPALIFSVALVILSSNIGALTGSSEQAVIAASARNGVEQARTHLLLGLSIDGRPDVSVYAVLSELAYRISSGDTKQFAGVSNDVLLEWVERRFAMVRCPDEQIAIAFYQGTTTLKENSFDRYQICIDSPHRPAGCELRTGDEPFAGRTGYLEAFPQSSGSILVFHGGNSC